MTLGDRIRSLRLLKKITQEELAEKAGVSRVTLGFYERGINQPTFETAAKIAKALNTSLDYLLTGSVEKKDDEQRLEEAIGFLESSGFDIESQRGSFLLEHNEYEIPKSVDADELVNTVEKVVLDARAKMDTYIQKRLVLEFQPTDDDWDRIAEDEAEQEARADAAKDDPEYWKSQNKED